MKRRFIISSILSMALFVPVVSFASIDVDLEYGMRGPKVTELQNILISKGFLTGVATGNFLSLTKKGVAAYQKSEGLPATGYVGPLTRAKLRGGTNVATTTTVPTLNSQSQSSPSLLQTPFYVGDNFWDFSSSLPFFHLTEKKPPVMNFASTNLLSERTIDPQSIVLVRCQYVPTYVGSVSGADVTPVAIIGTGVVVSPTGYILTAGHILRIKELVMEDKQRTWTRKSCEVAKTDKALSPINTNDYLDTTKPSSFIPATVVFEPSDTQYNPSKSQDPYNPNHTIYFGGGADLDFALLKVENANLPYAPVLSKLLPLSAGEKLLGIGYPGLETTAKLELERIDTQFNGYLWEEDSTCITKSVVEQCGIRYQGKRYKLDYKNLYGKQTELGKYTSYFRGGFSGGPLFYKGYVAGIMIVGRENQYSNLYDLGVVGQWNWVEALSTSEIVPVLKQAGINIEAAY